MIREKSPLLEASEALRDYRLSAAQREQRKIQEAAKERQDLMDRINAAKSRRELKSKKLREFSDITKTHLLEDAFKSIYIGSLMEHTALTDDGMDLANRLIENYVKENGAATILAKMNQTYVQECIKNAVLYTHKAIMEDAEENTDEEGNEIDKSKEINDEETPDVSDEKREEMYDDLSQEEDINKAVEMIAQRVSDAEQAFIKKNEEDKKALEDIANRFSERIKQVEEDPESTEQDIENAQNESSIIVNRMRRERRDNSVRNVFEQVVINLTESIIKDEDLRKQYISEDNHLDMGSVIESAKCIYGLLEFVNTLKLEKVDAKYIENALLTM